MLQFNISRISFHYHRTLVCGGIQFLGACVTPVIINTFPKRILFEIGKVDWDKLFVKSCKKMNKHLYSCIKTNVKLQGISFVNIFMFKVC